MINYNDDITLQGRTPKSIRKKNISTLLLALHRNKIMTIKELCDTVNLSKTTVIKLLNYVLEQGIVITRGKGDSTTAGGRRPDQYLLNEKYKFILSVEMDELGIFCRVMDMGGNSLYDRVTVYRSPKQYEDVFDETIYNIRTAMESIEISTENLAYLVISTTGIVDSDRGIIVHSMGIWKSDIPVVRHLKKVFGENISILMNNISRYSGYAELYVNQELKKHRVATILVWNDAIGGALIEQGEFIEGCNGMVGEVGKIYIDRKLYSEEAESNTNTTESILSEEGLLKYVNQFLEKNSLLYEKKNKKRLSISDIAEAAEMGDNFAINVIKRSVHYFSMILQNICFLYDPKYIIFQGVYQCLGERFVNDIYQELECMIPFFNVKERLKIQHSAIPYKDAFHIGACAFCTEMFLKSIE